MHYRRTAVKGGTYFFTINLFERRGTLLVENVDVLREVIHKVKAKHAPDSERGTAQRQQADERRTWNMATTLLGTSYP
jgi:hypothetical protein